MKFSKIFSINKYKIVKIGNVDIYIFNMCIFDCKILQIDIHIINTSIVFYKAKWTMKYVEPGEMFKKTVYWSIKS